ncbi:hypothetical protein CDO73_10985 [Saccharibacillus sp. O23]|nr:hypothetical protein CDO73_10985 [Saccharibacillus sp. O23]
MFLRPEPPARLDLRIGRNGFADTELSKSKVITYLPGLEKEDYNRGMQTAYRQTERKGESA